MKRIEVKLSLQAVAPLLDVIKSVADDLDDRLAVPVSLEEIDAGFRDQWREELLEEQTNEIRTFLALFDSEFFSTGIVGFDERNVVVIVRACSAIRLRLRERDLTGLSDDALEGGRCDIEALEPETQKAFLCYLFLATMQSLMLQHLDSAILNS